MAETSSPQTEPTTGNGSDNGNGEGNGQASRRKFLIGGAVGAAAVAAGVGVAVAAGRQEERPLGTTVYARRVRKVPVDDPDAGAWLDARVTRVELGPQVTTVPMKDTPSQRSVDVSALYDAKTIGFRLQWDCDDREELAIEVEQYRDACAVLLAPDGQNQALRLMGTADIPVTLLHWKADWQRDVDDGYQDPRVVYPNASFDYYPPMKAGTGDDVQMVDYEKIGATMWVPGMHVGNPLSQPRKTTPVEKLSARGFGTATTVAGQDAVGRGVWKDGSWRVVLAKPRVPGDDVEFVMTPGRDYGLAVAVWAGSQEDRGARKSPSKALLQLYVEPT